LLKIPNPNELEECQKLYIQKENFIPYEVNLELRKSRMTFQNYCNQNVLILSKVLKHRHKLFFLLLYKIGYQDVCEITVQPLTLDSVEEPTPVPSQEGNTKSPLLGGDLGVGELLLCEIYFPPKAPKNTIYSKKRQLSF